MIEIQNCSIRPVELSQLLSSGAAAELLDVRTPPEFARAHVPGAKLIPLNELNAQDYLRQHQPGRPVYVLCQAGMRAEKAIAQLAAAGCPDCVLVEGGTQAWIDAGLPVERGESKVLPLMRQVQIVVGSMSAIGAALALLVSPQFALIPLLFGCGLLVAGLTGTCGMALVLARMPWNRQIEASACCRLEEKQ
jgi:rhodanese-related sulfurtransferase